ncbi:hypothetical protein ACC691_39230, partial [Rhizobium johnstonii]|uniref:hypothetical protein n=1 Tax=Rhizobium johnstonii TaxID=3019933 RepID=UPI003F9D703C
FAEINVKLFGEDDKQKTQLDWIRARSKHQIYLLDAEQSVRPADVPIELLDALVRIAKSSHRHYPLQSQMRVQASAECNRHSRRPLAPA